MRKLLLVSVLAGGLLADGPANAQYLMLDGLPVNSEAVVTDNVFACDADVLVKIVGRVKPDDEPEEDPVVARGRFNRLVEQGKCRAVAQSTPVTVLANFTIQSGSFGVITQIRLHHDTKAWWISTKRLSPLR